MRVMGPLKSLLRGRRGIVFIAVLLGDSRCRTLVAEADPQCDDAHDPACGTNDGIEHGQHMYTDQTQQNMGNRMGNGVEFTQGFGIPPPLEGEDVGGGMDYEFSFGHGTPPPLDDEERPEMNEPYGLEESIRYNGEGIKRWAKLYRAKLIDNVVLEMFNEIEEKFTDEDPRAMTAYFGDIVSIAKKGLRLGDDEYKQFGEAGKKIIKEVYRLRKSPEGVQPPLMTFLWKQLAVCMHYDDEISRDFFAKLVIKAGLLNSVDDEVMPGGWTNLMLAARAGDMYVVNALVVAGANINLVSDAEEGKQTALHYALDAWASEQQLVHGSECSHRNYQDIIWTLVHHPHLDTTRTDHAGRSVLVTAISARHTDAVRVLVERSERSTINRQLPGSKHTALHVAIADSPSSILFAKWAVGHGNHYFNSSGLECVHNSLEQLNISVATALAAGVLPTWFDPASAKGARAWADLARSDTLSPPHSPPAITASVRHSNTDAVAAAVHAWSALHITALVVSGAAVNTRDALGRTPLHVACIHGHRPAVDLLLDAGADATLLDRHGYAAADLAASGGYASIVRALAQHTQTEELETDVYMTTHMPRVAPHLGIAWDAVRTAPVVANESLDAVRCDVDVRNSSDLTIVEFAKEYWARGRPVLLRGAINDTLGGGFGAWDRKALLKELNGYKLQLATTSTGSPTKSLTVALKKFAKYLDDKHDLLNAGIADAEPTKSMIIEARWNGHPRLHRLVLQMLKHVAPIKWMHALAKSAGQSLNNYQINIGAPYSGTSVHYHHEAISGLLHGRKRWFLYPPRHGFYSNAHFFDDFEGARNGDFGRVLQCTQQEGDVLFVPSLWGHGVLYEEVSVSTSFLFDLPGSAQLDG